MERPRLSEEAVLLRRRAVLHRPPQERTIFHELAPSVQAYVLLEHQKETAADQEEKKRLSVLLCAKSLEIFRPGKRYDQIREDISRYGEAVADELSFTG